MEDEDDNNEEVDEDEAEEEVGFLFVTCTHYMCQYPVNGLNN
jgi:hypothetical protein